MASPEPQDRVFDLYDLFCKNGVAMFHQQRRIYELLQTAVTGLSVLEAGCGTGQGTAMLSRTARAVVGTDLDPRNVRFCRELYPWIYWDAWDINKPSDRRAGTVIAVEVLEHVVDQKLALGNLINAAYDEVWLSVPNGAVRKQPPENPHHYHEPSPSSLVRLIKELTVGVEVEVMDWEHFDAVPLDTDCDPLVYHFRVR